MVVGPYYFHPYRTKHGADIGAALSSGWFIVTYYSHLAGIYHILSPWNIFNPHEFLRI